MSLEPLQERAGPGTALKADETGQAGCLVCESTDGDRVFTEANFDPLRLDRFAFASRKIPESRHDRLVECIVDVIAEAYRGAGFDSGEEVGSAARTSARFLPGIARRLRDRCGALDIDTGDGGFHQQLLAAGFTDVVGEEPSAAPVACAAEEVRPLSRRGVFQPEDFEPVRIRLLLKGGASPFSFVRIDVPSRPGCSGQGRPFSTSSISNCSRAGPPGP